MTMMAASIEAISCRKSSRQTARLSSLINHEKLHPPSAGGRIRRLSTVRRSLYAVLRNQAPGDRNSLGENQSVPSWLNRKRCAREQEAKSGFTVYPQILHWWLVTRVKNHPEPKITMDQVRAPSAQEFFQENRCLEAINFSDRYCNHQGASEMKTRRAG